MTKTAETVETVETVITRIYDESDVYIECPNCKASEEQPIDQSRKHFQYMRVLEWLPDVKGRDEISVNQCIECDHKFMVQWDYTNHMPLPSPNYVTYNYAKARVHDASGVDNPESYYWEQINGIYYPAEEK